MSAETLAHMFGAPHDTHALKQLVAMTFFYSSGHVRPLSRHWGDRMRQRGAGLLSEPGFVGFKDDKIFLSTGNPKIL